MTFCTPITISRLGVYHPRDSRDQDFAETTARFIWAYGDRAFGRDPHIGHVTASAFVVNQDRTEVLMMHHAKLDRWLQMGGHCDGNPNVLAAALREAREETGLASVRPVSSEIIDIDIHEIPARSDEPAHLHHDIRFLATADRAEPIRHNHEARTLIWVAISDLEQYTHARSILVLRDRLAEIC